jgi:hypothetical protein
MIANLQKQIEVPDSPGGRSDEPFDLGTIELRRNKLSNPAKQVPVSKSKPRRSESILRSRMAAILIVGCELPARC